ncbi:tRNA (5-methylaminomethyl-2-thiouridine)(34)-methyltransferase MnmD [Gloeothece verrucosa]|uniref:MnmC-like methyltransferase domain-containing protein n=1 Tax=Gloeothece verrucosa (strain PCC 7822) TaxID=497965 RepID=E0U5S0_GLOV7|nr:MnmC family methyltransferase [Gloeothece verrucosa]ADN15911.1 protein of unknown function DUF752 [Gloeothece verrucosa PCC 7822]
MTAIPSPHFFPQLTADGSYTFFSQEFDEAFHSCSGAKQEAQKKYIEPCQITQKASQGDTLKLLDICYGLGYNTAAALSAIWSVNPYCHVELIALELDANVPSEAIAHQLLKDWKTPIPELLTTLAETHQVKTPQFSAQLLIGDARSTIQQVEESRFQADGIFLDPFSPTKCPQLWTVEFLAKVSKCLSPQGRLATYSCAAAVRSALILAGLNIGSTQGVGRLAPGTLASLSRLEAYPLSRKEQEHLQTRAAIPYRDPQLCDPGAVICSRRAHLQQTSLLEPSSHWKKRWQREENRDLNPAEANSQKS